MKKIIIFGISDFARTIKWYIENDTDWEVSAFTVEAKFLEKKEFEGLKIVSFEDLNNYFDPKEYEILLAIGQYQMHDLRKRIFYESKEKGYNICNYIHSSSIVETENIGEGNIILERCIFQPYSKIGSGNLFWDNVTVSHDDNIGDFNTITGGVGICGYVSIGNNCFLGRGCIIHDRINIEDYVLVGAGACVKKDIDNNQVIVTKSSVILKDKNSRDFF